MRDLKEKGEGGWLESIDGDIKIEREGEGERGERVHRGNRGKRDCVKAPAKM